jgi:hypothetical protein
MYKPSNKAAVAAIAVAAGAAIFAGGAGAQAAGLVSSHNIKNDSILSRDIHDGTIRVVDLKPTTVSALKGATGTAGAPGKDGKDALFGAYYAVAYYDAGHTNAGAIATVGCNHQTDVAISGGVQVLGLGEGSNSRNTPVSSSFPGRMDWNTNAPKADRLDGWIVQFGGDADSVAPEKAKVWAMCVPGADVSIDQNYTESAD